MQVRQTEESTAVALEQQQLERQLERDTSAQLRDRLFCELHGTAEDIEAALARGGGSDAKILQPLLEAVRLSQDLVLDVWDSLHGSAVR
ncbi:MAG TPA: hypothetical protein VI653_12240 [Steroidobacteraceae bacterium]